MKALSLEKRQKFIQEYLLENDYADIKQLSEILDVSEMTIRRDIAYLKESHALTQTLGMNMISSSSAQPPMLYDFQYELERNVEAKERIARKASDMIRPRDILILDSSTTVSKIVPYIPHNMELTVISGNYYIINKLPKNGVINLIVPGGVYNRQLQMFESSEGINIIKEHRATKYFFSASGIHEHLGMTCSYAFEVLTKRAGIASSACKILLADSSKFGIITTSYFAKLNEADEIITDSGISGEWKKIIEDMGIELHIV